ncbi:FecR family protein [Glacieibacterium sp.]|uniref:FecR family protein n=1 Tax=Glacieibacterium sp. TaxID=2860237 RepID=UPI003AFFE3A5
MSGVIPDDAGSDRTERAATWAARLADGEMPVEQQAELQAWLDADPTHVRTIEEIVTTWDEVENYAASEAVMKLRQSALASARRSLNHRPVATYIGPLRAALIAASIVVLVAAVGIWAVLLPRTYSTGIGERRVVALADGSKISLDANTVVKVKFTRGDRRLWLEQGRAKFDVAKNPLRPFSVQAADEVVVATGTAFSVEMLQNHVHVVLYEGHVALLDRNAIGIVPTLSRGAAQLPADRLLTPGHEIILSSNNAAPSGSRQAVVEPADPVRSLSWEAGELVFNDQELGVVVERMNRYAEKPLRIGDAATSDVRVSGVFQAGDTNALVQGLSAAFDIKAEAGATDIVLVRRRRSESVG